MQSIHQNCSRDYNESHSLELCGLFGQACRSLGVAEHSLFETVDLFENKDLGLVVRCVFALGSSVQRTCPDFPGPHLGAKLHKVIRNTGDGAVLLCIGLFERTVGFADSCLLIGNQQPTIRWYPTCTWYVVLQRGDDVIQPLYGTTALSRYI